MSNKICDLQAIFGEVKELMRHELQSITDRIVRLERNTKWLLHDTPSRVIQNSPRRNRPITTLNEDVQQQHRLQ